MFKKKVKKLNGYIERLKKMSLEVPAPFLWLCTLKLCVFVFLFFLFLYASLYVLQMKSSIYYDINVIIIMTNY